MTENISIGNTFGTGEPDEMRYFEPSFLNALPHYLPLLIFPLLILAAFYGGFWLLGPFVFMSVAGFLDRVFGVDGLNMNPRGISERRFIWYNIPVWAWALLWPPTLVSRAMADLRWSFVSNMAKSMPRNATDHGSTSGICRWA